MLDQDRDRVVFLVHQNTNSYGSFNFHAKVISSWLKSHFKVVLIVPKESEFSRYLAPAVDETIYLDIVEPSLSARYIYSLIRSAFLILKYKPVALHHLDFYAWKPSLCVMARKLGVKTIYELRTKKTKENIVGELGKGRHLISISDYVKNIVTHSGYNGLIETSLGVVDYESFQKIHRHRPHIENLGFIGAISRGKGLHIAVEAFIELAKSYSDIKLIVGGAVKSIENSNSSLYMQTIQELIDNSGVSDRIRFLGHQQDVAEFMDKVDLLLVPSDEEAFGYVNIEAAASGVPVIAPKFGGITEAVANMKSGIVVEDNAVVNYVGAIRSLIESPGTYQSLQTGAIQFAQDGFLASRAEKELERIYKRLSLLQ